MKFVVDANLPPDLARWLADKRVDAIPVRALGVQGVTDDGIWKWAMDHGAIIVTKDGDFPARRAYEDKGPQVVWLRIGNSTKPVLFAWLDLVWDKAAVEIALGTPVVEIRRTK